MTGLRRLHHDEEAETLRIARGYRLGQAEEYQREMERAETALGLR